jgi:hypothetical protein
MGRNDKPRDQQRRNDEGRGIDDEGSVGADERD